MHVSPIGKKPHYTWYCWFLDVRFRTLQEKQYWISWLKRKSR